MRGRPRSSCRPPRASRTRRSKGSKMAPCETRKACLASWPSASGGGRRSRSAPTGPTPTRPSRRSPTSSIGTLASSPPRPALQGIAAAPGRVVAPVWRWSVARLGPSPGGLSGAEGIDQLGRAIERVKADLALKTARLQAGGLIAEAGILEAQALMLDDPALLDGASDFMAQGRPADEAVAAAMAPFAEMLRASPDPVFQARAADVEDVVEQLRRALHGASGTPPPPPQPSILLAPDLPPSHSP